MSIFTERLLLITLCVSLLAHGAIIFHNTDFYLFGAKKPEKITVTYVKDTRKGLGYRKLAAKKIEPPMSKIPTDVIAKKASPPPFVEMQKQGKVRKNNSETLARSVFNKPEFIKSDTPSSVRKKISLPAVDFDEPGKMNNPSYINYYQIVREKIKRAAYRNYAQSETGEVYLSFIIFSDGSLGEIKLSEEKTSGGQRLKDIALRSVKEASPFPAFADTLQYPQLSFNVVISFQIE